MNSTVTASRGVACVFAARKRALVYILDEDEDEVSDAEWLHLIYSYNKYVLHTPPRRVSYFCLAK